MLRIVFIHLSTNENIPFALKICCTTYKKNCIYRKKVVPLHRQTKQIIYN